MIPLCKIHFVLLYVRWTALNGVDPQRTWAETRFEYCDGQPQAIVFTYLKPAAKTLVLERLGEPSRWAGKQVKTRTVSIPKSI